jgi:hypothetical protein
MTLEKYGKENYELLNLEKSKIIMEKDDLILKSKEINKKYTTEINDLKQQLKEMQTSTNPNSKTLKSIITEKETEIKKLKEIIIEKEIIIIEKDNEIKINKENIDKKNKDSQQFLMKSSTTIMDGKNKIERLENDIKELKEIINKFIGKN